ncbi:MAG: methyltransferase family protein [Bacteroidetes bacterium]|nr:MAG: methyltransferase family protein [Bacteroidota bacterium]
MDRRKITFDTWNKVASIYQDKFMDLDLYNDTYDLFCRLIRKTDPRIFEIGCGPGNITRYLLSQRPDFKIEAIDMAPNMVKLAKENNPEAGFTVMDCREIDGLAAAGFDGIMCGFCMPYLSKEECAKLIGDCASLLNSGGIFYFSVIEDDYHKSGYETSSDGQDKAYVYYHEENYLQEALMKNGFESAGLTRKNYPKAGEVSSTHLVFITKKK